MTFDATTYEMSGSLADNSIKGSVIRKDNQSVGPVITFVGLHTRVSSSINSFYAEVKVPARKIVRVMIRID